MFEHDCPFCTIAYNDLLVPEDRDPGITRVTLSVLDCMVFEPRHPVTPGHLLVIPMHHVPSAVYDPEATGVVFEAAAAVLAMSGKPGNLITSVGAAATQTVQHLHVHVVPRREGDGLHLPWTGQVTS
jgi:histidine triad (HIT) family protein